jgi:hypothetical protein
MNYKLKKISWWLGFVAFTAYPYIFHVEETPSTRLILHESKHIEQQKKWYDKAWYFGVAAWLFCYLLLFPVGYNIFRWNWEFEAYKTNKFETDESIKERLWNKYLLWFN